MTSPSSEIINKLKNEMVASWNGENDKLDNICLRKKIIHTIFNKTLTRQAEDGIIVTIV